MRKKKSLNLCVIGAGRVGTTVGYIFKNKNIPGIKLRAVASRTGASINRARRVIGSDSGDVLFTIDNKEAALMSDCALICTPDDEIKRVSEEISGIIKNKKQGDYYVIHFSGNKTLGVLKSAEDAGARTASIHPLKSFASIDESIRTMAGTIFSLAGSDPDSKRVASMLVKSMGGRVIDIEEEKKPLYHAAACIASNYLVTLLNYAEMVFRATGISPKESLECITYLVDGTIDNVRKMGTEKSLTGPIARGDIGTVRDHIENLRKYFTEEEVDLYRKLGLETVKIASRNKWINDGILRELKKILEHRKEI